MQLLAWVLYFSTDVYGHVALKIATRADSFTGTLFSFWGVSAGASWVISVLAWTFVLSKNSFLTANTVSAITYILTALAAVLVFKEQITMQNMVGIVCVFVGIYLVTH